MKIEFWPQCVVGRENEEAPVLTFINELRGDMLLWKQVVDVIDKEIAPERDIDELYNDEDEPLVKYLKGHISELRIPPNRPEGVARIYFGYDPDDRQRIIFYDGELKKDSQNAANQAKLDQCERQHEEMFG